MLNFLVCLSAEFASFPRRVLDSLAFSEAVQNFDLLCARRSQSFYTQCLPVSCFNGALPKLADT